LYPAPTHSWKISCIRSWQSLPHSDVMLTDWLYCFNISSVVVVVVDIGSVFIMFIILVVIGVYRA
jgi:hypothetical protein